MPSRTIAVGSFAGLSLLWLVFGWSLIFQRDLLNSAWAAPRSWPIVLQLARGCWRFR